MRTLVAMSGGVDSSVAAYLLKEQGDECAGAMMRLFDNADSADKDARDTALKIGVPFFLCDFSEDFRRQVMLRFVRAYLDGETPNPCVDCNRCIKFGLFLTRARLLGYERIATGHYARTEKDSASGRWLLKKATDAEKDQSYVLYAMTQDQIAHTVFPLGGLTKVEVRAIAEARGFINAGKKESQDICFVPGGDYAEFIERVEKKPFGEGDMIDTQGRVLGRHKGAIRFTIGQRRGIGVSTSGEPLYVCATDTARNTVVLGTSEELYAKTLAARGINLIAFPRLDKPLRVKAKIRYRMREAPAAAEQTGEDSLRVTFDEPQRAITKGQAVVLYDGDTVIGGGTIAEIARSAKTYY